MKHRYGGKKNNLTKRQGERQEDKEVQRQTEKEVEE